MPLCWLRMPGDLHLIHCVLLLRSLLTHKVLKGLTHKLLKGLTHKLLKGLTHKLLKGLTHKLLKGFTQCINTKHNHFLDYLFLIKLA